MLILKQLKQKKQEAEFKKKMKEGLIKDYQSKDAQENDASIFI